MQEFLHLEKCAENNTTIDLSTTDPLYLFELGLEYLNIEMFEKSLESYIITSNDIKYIKKRLTYELNEDKPNYELIVLFLNKVVSSSLNFKNTDVFLPLLTNIFNVKLRDSVFGNLFVKLSKEIRNEYASQFIDVALYNEYNKSLKILFNKFDIDKDAEKLIKQCKKYKKSEKNIITLCQNILERKNSIDKFKEITEYTKKGINKKTQNVFYLTRAIMT